MKHTLKVTILLVTIFFVSQLIGLAVTNEYIDHNKTSETGNITWSSLPYNIERPEIEEGSSFIYIISAILLGTLLVFLIIKFGKNDKLLKERIVYARSCDAGMILGSGCMDGTKNGCFIGYNLPFIFYMDRKWTTKPHNDKVAGLFLDPSNIVPISIIKGHTALEAHNNAKKGMLKTMKKLLKGQQEEETPFYLEALWNNYYGQVISGNSEVKL